MSAHVKTVKSAAAQVIAESTELAHLSPQRAVYNATRMTFLALYGRQYAPATDRREFERIKWHVKRALNGDTGPGRGGKRDGAGRPTGASAWPKGEQAG